MKFTANLFLLLVFIPLFLAGIILSSIRFQLLSPDYWQNTFRSNGVYGGLAAVVKKSVENQTAKGGGNLSEIRFITNIITPENLQDFLEKNIKNILDFANGKAKEAMVYIPVSKLPKGLLPRNLAKISETVPLTTVLTEFNVRGFGESQIQTISKAGAWVAGFFTLDLIVLAAALSGMILLVDGGKRFIAPGIALITGGVLTLVLSVFGNAIKDSMLTDWIKSSEPSQIILAPFAPYILDGVLKNWTIVGFVAIALGVVFLFIRKPGRKSV